MKIILMIVLFSALTYGIDFNYKMENNIRLSSSSYSIKDSPKNKDITDNLVRSEYRNYLNLYIDKYLFIASGISVFDNDKEIPNDRTGDFYLNQSKSGIIIEKLYGQLLLYKSDNKISLVYGVIPLSGGNFKKFSRYNEERGNGLFTLINLSLKGGFLVCSNEHYNLRIGQAKWDDSFYNDENLAKNNEGSNGTFIFYDYTIGKHLIELNYIQAEFKKDNYKIGNDTLYGLGYSYDDSEVTGWSIYTILGYSSFKSNTYDWLENSGKYNDNTIKTIKMVNKYKPDEYNFNNDKWYGYSILLGIKKLMDLKGKDVTLGLEYYKASNNWVSMNIGTVNSGNSYGYWKHRGGNTIKIYNDIYLMKNFIIHTDYTYSYNLKSAKLGSIADTSNNSNIKDLYKKENILSFELIYKF